jgi:hypothetical protein
VVFELSKKVNLIHFRNFDERKFSAEIIQCHVSCQVLENSLGKRDIKEEGPNTASSYAHTDLP